MACLDTTFLLDLHGKSGRRAAARAADLLRAISDREEQVVTTRFNVAELYVGLERSVRPEAESGMIEAIISTFEVLEFDDASARHFGRITARLQLMGRPAGDMDVLIAAVCIAGGHGLVTRNPRHFIDIEDLIVESY